MQRTNFITQKVLGYVMEMQTFPPLAVFFKVFRGGHNKFAIFFLLIPIFFLCWVPVLSQGSEQKPCKSGSSWIGAFANGLPLTQETLDDLVAEHKEWLITLEYRVETEIQRKCGTAVPFSEEFEDCFLNLLSSDWEVDKGRLNLLSSDWEVDKGRLNLQEAKLSWAKLQEAELSWANLQGAGMQWAKLQGATLQWANLQGADMQGAKLQKARLDRAILQGAELSIAKLQGASMRWAELQGATLVNANLQGADMQWAKLQGANMQEANLQEAMMVGTNLQGADMQVANLQEAMMVGTNLQGANMRWARLQGADMQNTKLQGAYMQKAELQGAYMWGTKLQGAYMQEANLQGANMQGANLQEATLVDANLQGANMQEANLQGANMQGAKGFGSGSYLNANLKAANLKGIDLTGHRYEPKPGGVPAVESLVNTEHLETLWYKTAPHGLIELRKTFKEAGYREQERKITYAIKRSELDRMMCRNQEKDKCIIRPIEATFNLLFFELPVAYGMYPGRAFKILIVFIFLFAIPYTYTFAQPESFKKKGVWRVWPTDRQQLPTDKDKPEFITVSVPKSFWYAIYFSMLSAFHIGWRDFNIGNWLSRIQPRGYVMLSNGWVRVLSGIQSLISVYLLAIWALTYFGRPFG